MLATDSYTFNRLQSIYGIPKLPEAISTEAEKKPTSGKANDLAVGGGFTGNDGLNFQPPTHDPSVS